MKFSKIYKYNNIFYTLPHKSNIESYEGEKKVISEKWRQEYLNKLGDVEIKELLTTNGLNDVKYKIINRVTINDYIENVFSSDNLEKLFIISHPHRKHITNEYKLDIKDLIDEALNLTYHRDSIILIDQFDYNNFNNLDHVFIKGDKSSHLNNNYFIERFLKQILKILESQTQIIG